MAEKGEGRNSIASVTCVVTTTIVIMRLTQDVHIWTVPEMAYSRLCSKLTDVFFFQCDRVHDGAQDHEPRQCAHRSQLSDKKICLENGKSFRHS